MVHLTGWVELEGILLSVHEIEEVLVDRPDLVSRFGGEFYLEWADCAARDKYGIVQGGISHNTQVQASCPPGSIVRNGDVIGEVAPETPELDLETAITEAVRLRCGEGVTALSGGVDSALVAALAGLPCICVGVEGAHDPGRAREFAGETGLTCEYAEISRRDVEEGALAVARVLPDANPLAYAIAITQWCITRWAGEHGYRRVLTGQGADELFGGYARYHSSTDLAGDLSKDFQGLLRGQLVRDQSVAALHGVCFSLPYLDVRVVRAAAAIPAGGKVHDGVGKWPLRTVAERHIPQKTAWYGKKAMQYGSGVSRVLRELARHNGYKRSVQGYINQISGQEHGIRERS
jgi:asparagine synthase (glutamine-hydrolysing)